MKIRILLCAVVLAFVSGCDPDFSESLEQQNARLRNQNAQLWNENRRLSSQLSSARSEISELRRALAVSNSRCEKTQNELSGARKAIDSQASEMKAKDEAAKKKIKELEDENGVRPYWKWIVFGIGGIMIAVVAFLVVAGLRSPVVVSDHEDDLPRCPRCGWKYTRGETKCRNCGTRF